MFNKIKIYSNLNMLDALMMPMPAMPIRSLLEEAVAPEQLKELEKATALLQGAKLVGPQGDEHTVPVAIYELMCVLLDHLKRGMAFTVFPSDALLTTQQAAQVLNVSRAHLNQLLAANEIPYEMVGRHRRLRLDNVLSLRQRQFEQRSAILDDLSALGQELQGESL
ncbi:MAG: helix-turn-helix domain-containing protein [Synechococcus sp. SB0677_bin_5]|nr:helix-turn-helix domain-containing protein [Synechococcus sp. SB0677_bin_5]